MSSARAPSKSNAHHGSAVRVIREPKTETACPTQSF